MKTTKMGQPITATQRRAARASRDRMMARAVRLKRVWRYRLHAAVLLPLAGLLRLLPVEAAARLGGWLGRELIPRFDNFNGSLRSVRIAFPDIGDAAARQVLVGMCENIGMVLGESLHLDAFAGPDNERLHVIGVNHVRAAQALDSGVLFVSGHFGNWELFEVALATLGLKGAKVLQHAHNPYLVEPVALHRYAFGLDEQIAQGEGVFVRARAALRAGRVVQMLCDQRTTKGAKVPFFGLETTTNLVPARLARETGAPLVLMRIKRLGPARFEITFQPPRRFEYEDDEVEIMTWINGYFEGEIRAVPTQWLWSHPRWGDVFANIAAAPLVTPPEDDQ